MSAVGNKINMSLDEIIKSQKSAAKKTAKPAAKKTAAKPSPAAAGKKAGKGKGKAVAAAPVSKKAAQSIGGAQAKRAATTAQRRGLATTGKATNAQVRNQVKKAGAKLQTQSVASAGRRAKGRGGASAAGGQPRPNSAPAAVPAGLKISFKPAELKKTTEKNVALQIRAVLGKTPTNVSNAPRNNNAPRQVATGGASGAGARRSNPKRRNQQRGGR